MVTTTHFGNRIQRDLFGGLAPEISGVFDSKNPGSNNVHNNLQQFIIQIDIYMTAQYQLIFNNGALMGTSEHASHHLDE